MKRGAREDPKSRATEIVNRDIFYKELRAEAERNLCLRCVILWDLSWRFSRENIFLMAALFTGILQDVNCGFYRVYVILEQ